MAGPLIKDVQIRLPWLFDDLGFRVTYHDYSPKAFGDSIVELQSDALRLRFVRDRSIIQAEIASLSEPERWMDLGFLWYALTKDRPEPALDGWGLFVRDHLGALAEALGPNYPHTKEQFELRQRESREAFDSYRRRIAPSRVSRFRTVLSAVIWRLGWIIAGILFVMFISRP